MHAPTPLTPHLHHPVSDDLFAALSQLVDGPVPVTPRHFIVDAARERIVELEAFADTDVTFDLVALELEMLKSLLDFAGLGHEVTRH